MAPESNTEYTAHHTHSHTHHSHTHAHAHSQSHSNDAALDKKIEGDISQGTDSRGLYSHVEQLQKQASALSRQGDLSRINHASDLSHMGFPCGSQLLGAHNGNIEARDLNGHIQYRDKDSGNIVASQTVQDKEGARNYAFETAPDGSYRYKVNPGDSFDSIAKSALHAQLGREPSAQEMHDYMPGFAKANNRGVKSTIYDGETLVVPKSNAQPGDSSTKPGGACVDTSKPQDVPSALKPKDDAYNAANPPGMAELQPGQSNNDGMIAWGWNQKNAEGAPNGPTNRWRDAQKSDTPSIYGGDHYQYKGGLYDNNTGAYVNYNGSQDLDSSGHVAHSKIHYDTPLSINLQSKGGGQVTINDVSDIETSRGANGGTVTTIRYGGGKTHTSYTNSSGQVTDFQ